MSLRLLCAWFVARVHRTLPSQEAQRFHTITFLKPRPKVTAIAKADKKGRRRAMDALAYGYILGIAPEGTRSRSSTGASSIVVKE